jgi:cysteine desulfuration protein SufE
MIELYLMNDINEDFKLLDNWLDRYQYIIDLGKQLELYPEEYKTDDYKVRGCQSQVWLYMKQNGDKLHFIATSDAAIVCGLIYLLLQIYNDLSCEEIINRQPDFITQLGLDKHLSPTRKNGLHAMVQRIKQMAADVCAHKKSD